MAELLDEIHPGEILLEEFLKPMGISARQLAADIDVSPSRISEVVNGLRPITADTALRLGLFFNMEPRFWMNLQTDYSLATTFAANGEENDLGETEPKHSPSQNSTEGKDCCESVTEDGTSQEEVEGGA